MNKDMKILALDTSTEYLSLALMIDDWAITRDVHAGQSHSQRVLPLLREMLNEAGLEVEEMDGIAFGAGPGSFTGLRIGCGIAQGLGFAAEVPVVGVSTLNALAEGVVMRAPDALRVVACLDARMGEVYHAAYEKNDDVWQEVSGPGLYRPENVPQLQGEGWVGVGTGWAVYRDQLQSVYGRQLKGVLLQANVYDHPNALAIAHLARPILSAGLGKPAADAMPIYIRNKVALKMSER